MDKPLLRRGRVVDDGGQPVIGALLSVEWGTVPTPEIAVQTDENGEFRLALPKGRFRIAAHAPDGRAGTVELTTEEADEEIVVRVEP